MLALATALLLVTMPGPVEAPAAAATQLVLKLEANKSTFVLYEPLTLTYKVENPTSEAITAWVHLDDSIEFFITGPDGTTEEYRGRASLACGVADETVHEPGSVVTSEIDLGWRGKRNLFPVAGEYEIRARLYAGSRPKPVFLESNQLRIEIQVPSGDDAAAIAFFASVEEFKRLLRVGATKYCQGGGGPSCFEQIRQFVQEHGASAYTPKVVWNLAAAVSYGRLDVEPKYDLAAGLYRRFLDDWPDHPNAPRVMYSLAVMLDRAGRYGEAGEVILEFEARFPKRKKMAASLRTNFTSGIMLNDQ